MALYLSSDPVLYGTVSASAAASVNLSTIYNQYSIIEVHFWNILPSTNSVNLNMLTSTNGSSYDSGSSAYNYSCAFVNSSPAINYNPNSSATATTINLAAAVPNTTGSATTSVKVVLYNPSNTGSFSNFQFEVNTLGAKLWGTGCRLAAQATQGIQLSFSSGNISCNYTVIGHP